MAEETQEDLTKTREEEGKIVNREYAQGFSLTGDFVAGLKNKTFKIIAQRNELVQDLDNIGQLKEKTILTVQLADGTPIEYYPNKTSQAKIINKRGLKFSDWINFNGEFEIAEQRVGKENKKVIYIK